MIFVFLALLPIICYSQQTFITVQSFEYIWQKKITSQSAGSQVNILLNEDSKLVVEKSFVNAIQRRWNTTAPQLKLTVKSFSPLSFSNTPKFSTKIKEKKPGTWTMFLQLFADGSTVFYNEDGSLATPIQVKCRIISFDESIVFERNLTVKMNTEKAPSDQVVLEKLNAHPTYYLNAFDSIAAWLFQPENITIKEVWLKPACVYTERKPASQTITQIFHSSEPVYTRKTSDKNSDGNSVSGAVTLFTGISVNKVKIHEYAANFHFKDDDSSVYNCIVNFAEREITEREREKIEHNDGTTSYSLKSGSYRLAERRTDSQYLNIITKGTDTLATFTISYLRGANERSNYTQLWDGNDSSSILSLPHEWNNRSEEDNIVVRVKTAGYVFYMKAKEENNVKVFYFQDKPALIIYGKTLPSKALVMQSVPAVDIKLCAILASLPYAYFNYSAL